MVTWCGWCPKELQMIILSFCDISETRDPLGYFVLASERQWINDSRITQKTEKDSDGWTVVKYTLNGSDTFYHRLDGPAIERKISNHLKPHSWHAEWWRLGNDIV